MRFLRGHIVPESTQMKTVRGIICNYAVRSLETQTGKRSRHETKLWDFINQYTCNGPFSVNPVKNSSDLVYRLAFCCQSNNICAARFLRSSKWAAQKYGQKYHKSPCNAVLLELFLSATCSNWHQDPRHSLSMRNSPHMKDSVFSSTDSSSNVILYQLAF